MAQAGGVCPPVGAGRNPPVTRPRVSIPIVLFITGISLVVGVIVTNAVHRRIERSNGVKHPHNFTSHGVRAALGGVLILGIFLILSGIVWMVATRRERRQHAQPEI